MKLWLWKCSHLVVVGWALGLGTVAACAGLITGFDTGNFRPIQMVDPLTGQVASLPTAPFMTDGFATSSGPAYNSILFYSPINIYQLDVISGQRSLYACPDPLCAQVGDVAYDSSTGVIYGLGSLGSREGLFRLNDGGTEYPGIPGSHWISYSSIGELGVGDVSVMEFVPGLGLYGVSNRRSEGFVIDENTGRASPLAPLSGMTAANGITGLAYDSWTGRLLASSGRLFGPASSGAVFLLDPRNGSLTPLNLDAPNLYGIAEARTPEPGPAWMVLVGLAACFLRDSGRHNCSAARGMAGLGGARPYQRTASLNWPGWHWQLRWCFFPSAGKYNITAELRGEHNGVPFAQREEKDASEGNRRCPFLAQRIVPFSRGRSKITYVAPRVISQCS